MASTFFGSAEMKRKITLSGIFGVAEMNSKSDFQKTKWQTQNEKVNINLKETIKILLKIHLDLFLCPLLL